MDPFGPRVLVTAFEGWNDAGEAASDAVTALREAGGHRRLAGVDPELYFDFQYTRPLSVADADGGRHLQWPEASVWGPGPHGPTPRLWVLTGAEPARAWRAFSREVVDIMLREDITSMITLGALMSDVPHTRPITVSVSSEDDRMRRALDVERSSYEGPVGILSVLADAAADAGIPSVALWASVPHYVGSQSSSPKASLALLDCIGRLTGEPVQRGDLPARAAEWEAGIDAAAAEDDDMSRYIRRLEEARDAWDSPDASGEALAREFEQYLRRRGDGPGHGEKDGRRG